MAALTVRPQLTFDGHKLFEHALRDLPPYARPLFVRIQVTDLFLSLPSLDAFLCWTPESF